jgi:dimeric dUTPase (all-alpha-NTP-PPase superfamily)
MIHAVLDFLRALTDPERLIQHFVLQNPRITDEEVIAIARNRNLEADLLRKIGEHKYWTRNYQVKLALVANPKTPLATALHFVSSLMERDIRFIAKSKNISSTIVSQARRVIMQREKK